MLGISFAEFLVIALACFLIIGPERMGVLAQKIGKLLSQVRQEITHIKEIQIKDFDDSVFYEPKLDVETPAEDGDKSPQRIRA